MFHLGDGFCVDRQTADRLAVGVSPLTRPDSFHGGSGDGERQDWVGFTAFDVGWHRHLKASVCFSKPCCVRLAELPGAGATRPFLSLISARQLPIFAN